MSFSISGDIIIIILKGNEATPPQFQRSTDNSIIFTWTDQDQGRPVYGRPVCSQGTHLTTQDIEFIISNKVTHVINTVSKNIPNLY